MAKYATPPSSADSGALVPVPVLDRFVVPKKKVAYNRKSFGN